MRRLLDQVCAAIRPVTITKLTHIAPSATLPSYIQVWRSGDHIKSHRFSFGVWFMKSFELPDVLCVEMGHLDDDLHARIPCNSGW